MLYTLVVLIVNHHFKDNLLNPTTFFFRKLRAQAAGLHDAHQGHYNYQGGDYDKEDPPANNEAEGENSIQSFKLFSHIIYSSPLLHLNYFCSSDEDLDQIDYNNEPNQANPLHQVPQGHQPPKMLHRRMAVRLVFLFLLLSFQLKEHIALNSSISRS